jgi:two-component system, sensor histidine kinase and response regulator
LSTPAASASAEADRLTALESENAALAARSFRIVGTIVFLFQFLYFAADRATKTQYQHFFTPYFVVNAIDAVFAVAVTYSRRFPRYWKPLALVQVGLLDGTGTVMNILRGTVSPQFYIIITFSFGCATFLPWGVIWQSALNLICLTSYVAVNLNATVAEPYVRYQWIALLAVLILSEFPAAFIDQYRRRVFRQLEELAMALKASQAKSEFLASMSHEMRTPLHTIIGITEVLEGTDLTPDEQAQYLNVCRSSGDALLGLINDIVDISRIEAGELKLDRAEFDLNELMDQLADALALRAHRKDLELIFSVTQGTPVKLIGDPMRLRQVCLNLLVNAIKFTDKGQVVMRVEPDAGSREAGALRFSVADTGTGIALEEQKRIFTRFARTASAVSGGREGSGLGLEISKRLVEAMRGRIWMESVPGMGSTFYFTCRVDVQSAHDDDSSDKSPLVGTRVLVADDNAAGRAVIGEILNSAGASVSLCSGAAPARQELSRAHNLGFEYHVILVDAQMPPDDGIELAREFDPSYRERTIVMFTRDDFLRGTRAGRNAGLIHHLLKPIKRGGLLDAVACVMARDQIAAGRPAAPRPLRVEDSPAFRILLAEDSEDNRLLMAAFLRNSPYQLDTAENGRIAVEMFKTRRYDLVLLDLNMPVMGGYSAVAAMREWEREQGASPTPLVALTGKAMAEDRVRSIEVGCNGHLTKPLQREALMEAISRFSSAAPAN